MAATVDQLRDHVVELDAWRDTLEELADFYYQAEFDPERYVDEGESYLEEFVAAFVFLVFAFATDEILDQSESWLQAMDVLDRPLTADESDDILDAAFQRINVQSPSVVDQVDAVAAAWVSGLVASGMSLQQIRANLLSGPEIVDTVFGRLRNEMKDMARNVVKVVDEAALDSIAAGPAPRFPGRLFRWVTVGGEKVCGSRLDAPQEETTCVARHFKVKPYAEWVELGLPGAGATLCRRRCRCLLVPVDGVTGVNEDTVRIDDRKDDVESAKPRIRREAVSYLGGAGIDTEGFGEEGVDRDALRERRSG